MNINHDQIANFLTRYGGYPMGDDPEAPKTVFPSDLELDVESEKRLVEAALAQKQFLVQKMGREDSYANNWYASATGADSRSLSRNFMASRQLWEMVYHQKMEWRASVVGGIFTDHNLTIPLTRRITQQQLSRANDYFFSTDPWFAISPVGVEDERLAEDLNRFARWKLTRSSVKDSLMKAVENAFIRGEQVIKPGYVKRTSRYESTASVAIGDDGKPLVAEDGEYIFEDDLMISSVGDVPLTDEEGNQLMTLKRNPGQAWPLGYKFVFEERKVWREIVLEDDVEIACVYFKDFLCDPAEASVQTAPCVIHLYDQSAFEVAHKYMERGGGTEEDLRRIVDLMREWQSEDGTPKAEMGRPRPELGETGSLADTGGDINDSERPDTVVEIAEVYIRFDANGDGIAEDIFLLLDVANKRPIYYNYLGNVTPDGKRPFHVVRVNPVDGRWHGIGSPETFWPLQEHVDLLVNRWNQAQSGSGWIDIVNPKAVKEVDADGNVEINGGLVYHLTNDHTFDDFFKRVPLYDNRSEDIRTQIEFDMQLAMNMSGISNTNDNNAAGMDSTKLATGIRNIERSGQELFGPFLSHLEPGISGAVKGALALLVGRLDSPEVYEYFEGDARRVAEFKPETARDIDIDVSLELTRYKGEQEVTQLQYAKAGCNQFYDLPIDRQVKLASLYRNELKRYGIKNADELIEPGAVAPLPVGGPGANPAAAAAAAPMPKIQPNV